MLILSDDRGTGVVEPAVDPPWGDGGARVGPGEHEGDAARVRLAPARTPGRAAPRRTGGGRGRRRQERTKYM